MLRNQPLTAVSTNNSSSIWFEGPSHRLRTKRDVPIISIFDFVRNSTKNLSGLVFSESKNETPRELEASRKPSFDKTDSPVTARFSVFSFFAIRHDGGPNRSISTHDEQASFHARDRKRKSQSQVGSTFVGTHTCFLVTSPAPSFLSSSSIACGACRFLVDTAACLATFAAIASTTPPAALAATYLDGVSDKPTAAAMGTIPLTPARHSRPGGVDCFFIHQKCVRAAAARLREDGRT